MSSAQQAIFLKDYKPPAYLIDETQLKFVLNDDVTRVHSRLLIRKNPAVSVHGPLVLAGESLKLQAIALDGEALPENAYQVDEKSLTIAKVPEQFILTIETEIKPQENTTLSGLYRSNQLYCTQCEAHGFRRITYYLDRPDVMSSFTTIIEADKTRYPVLLSNGNCVATGTLAHNRHWVEWQDPYKKPAYLFALVAGSLVCVQDTFITMQNREIQLAIYVEAGHENNVIHAMESLKQAMRWDEEAYGREYDLDIYMIVAVNDFNMGAMENKGLNIFNAKYIFASPEVATDADYQNIQHVVAHEYFHNWSGNRVTLRDWFQLSLKEGFTVFREQQFAADTGSRSMQRIEQAKLLRSHQFTEDAGPMAHAVRPESYIEINNFYTMTVYEKGSEVIRMLATLLGPEDFRKGTDLYFSRYDGMAATTDDFVAAMQSVTTIDLTQFKLWYAQAGTPELTVNWQYNSQASTLTLHVAQHTPPTPGQPIKQALHIPLKMALLAQNGELLPLNGASSVTEAILHVNAAEQTFVFHDILEAPIPSLLRTFSAPVKLKADYTAEQLLFIAKYDNDAFCRYDAAQGLYLQFIFRLIKDYQSKTALVLPDDLITLMRTLLTSWQDDPMLIAAMIRLPSETEIMGLCDVIDVNAIHAVHAFLSNQIANALRNELSDCYQNLLQTGPYIFDAEQMARRALKNTCLHYLSVVDMSLAQQQFNLADNMTDSLAALHALNNSEHPARKASNEKFYEKWQGNTLVLDKWFAIQALADVPTVLEDVKKLLNHKAFDLKNPNKVQSLLGQFARNNPYYFHQADGAAYALYEKLILELDKLNPQVSARLAQPFTAFKRFEPKQKELMKQLLMRLQQAKLSSDLFEIVSKSLSE